VEELIATAHDGGPAVLGLEATLMAITAERVRLLVVDERFSRSGSECPNGHYIGAVRQKVCPICGTELAIQSDIVIRAKQRVLEQGGHVSPLKSVGGRQALEQHGQIGAFLRDAGLLEQKSVQAYRKEHERTRTSEERIDEAVEETFPASDPPAL
jgi:peptide subunit release factor 1 (eRF1)